MRDLPIYDITLDDDNWGIYAVSLVEDPAIDTNFIYMSAEDESTFVFADEEKREIIGPILIPDILIYRKIKDQEFYVKFSKETIVEINERMQKTDGNKYFTVEHELGANGTVLFLESWIKETEEDKSSAFGIDAPLGSLFIKAKVESDLLWDMVKAERLKGFSVELDASIIKAQLSKLTKEEPQMIDYKSMYSNSLDVNDTSLLYNGTLTVGSTMFEYSEAEDTSSIAPYTGSFTIDNVEYHIADGLVTEERDIQLSIEERLDSVLAAFEALRTELTPAEEGEGAEDLNEKLDAILTRIEEERLERLQASEANAEEEEEEEVHEFSVEDYKSVGEWFKKWN